MKEAGIRLDQLSVVYTNGQTALEAVHDMSLRVAPSEIVSLIGPSGCGKTTILKAAAGLLVPASGAVVISPDGRPPLMVFQQYDRCLLPYLNIRQNVEIVLLNNMGARTQSECASRALATAGLVDTAEMYPWQLSGGMQQRVLLARCLAAEPPGLLLDEPFSSVDAQTRYMLEDATRTVVQRVRAAAIYVTHDIDSALYCGDRVVVLSPRPARIVAELTPAFGKERSQVETRSSRAFADLRRKICAALEKAYA